MTDLAPTLAMPQAFETMTLETKLLAAKVILHGERQPYNPHTPAGPPSPEALAHMATLAWCDRPAWVVQPKQVKLRKRDRDRIDVDKTVFYRRLVQRTAAEIINR